MPEETVQEEVKEELTAEEIEAAAAESETTETEVVEEVKEKTWAESGLNERYDSMSREQIAGDIKQRNTAFGNLTNDNETLRRQVAELETKGNKVREAADLPAEVKSEVKKMSEEELRRWLDDLQTDPHAAIRSLLGDSFGRRSDDDLSKFIDKRVNEGLNDYHGYTEEQAVRADPDYPVFANYIEGLQDPKYFGDTRSPRELLDFARLFHTDREAANAVYGVMKRFPSVPMKDCVRMVNGTPKAAVDADKIREQVKDLAGGGLPPGSNKVSSSEKIEDMHTAFHPDEE